MTCRTTIAVPLVLACLLATPRCAQVATSADFPAPESPSAESFSAAEVENPPLSPDPDAWITPDYTPRDVRSGMFQKLFFDGTWLPNQGANGLGMSTLDGRVVLGVPCPTRQWPMLVSPGFAVWSLDAPAATRLPKTVYDAYTEFRWFPRFGSRLMLDIAATPGVYGDYVHETGNGFRVTAHAAAVWQWTSTTRLVLGLEYEDRRDWNFLPIGGLLWYPTPDLQADILFPEPKISYRLRGLDAERDDIEHWIYIGGEFADELWGIQEPGGVADRVAYSDIRAVIGYQRKSFGRITANIDVGYVFSRKLSYYLSGQPEIDPSPTLMLRGGLAY